MSGSIDDRLAQQRYMLREQLMAQRLVINQQLESPDCVAVAGPRSVTMQVLRSRPELVLRLLTRIVSFLRSDSRGGNGNSGAHRARLLLAIPLLLALVVMLRSVQARQIPLRS